jgi:hypothetical protein
MRRILIAVLFLCAGMQAQVVVANGLWSFVFTAPSGLCSQNSQPQFVMGPGTLYTCQSGTWGVASSGAGGTVTLSATGTADQTAINSAYTTLNAAGGGTIFLNAGTYHCSACIAPKNNVSLIGVPPGLTGFDGQSDDYWTFNGTGTLLQGDGAEVGVCFNNTPSSNPAAYLAANSLAYAKFENLGFTNFTRAFDIGSQDNPGMYFGTVRNVYASTNTQWGFHFENFSETLFEKVFAVSNTIGDMWFGSTVNNANYQPGNSIFLQVYSSPLNNLARGIVFAAPGAESNSQSILNSLKGYDLQVNRFRDTLTTQTITPANASTSIAVTDLTKFKVGMPFWVTATADGYTANLMYFVLTVSGSSGAGTITAGTSAAAVSAITANASTALTLNSYGFANMELAGSSSTVTASTINAILQGLDLEGSSSIGFYDEQSSTSTYQVSSATVVGGPSFFVLRGSTNPSIQSNQQLSSDIGGNVGSPFWNGSRGVVRNISPPGLFRDATLNTWAINLTTFGSDVYARNPPGGVFLYPSAGIGEQISTQDTSITLVGNWCGGVLTFNGAAGQTFTLPVIDNASVKNASVQGCRTKIVNASANTLAIATSSSQTFNNVAAKTTTTMVANSVLELTAATTGSGSVLYWVAMYIPATALP